MRDAEFEQRLLRVARGLEKADLVLKGGNVFNSFTGEWETADVAVCGSVIAGIGSYKGAEEYNMAGKYLTPGFLDAHMHIESTMLAPRELARLLLLNGVTGIFADPHEIANVLGTEGLQWMLAETEDMPLDVFFMLPSCVPATGMETSGAVLEADALQPFLRHPRVLGLGEMMNYPGVLYGDEGVMKKMALVRGGICDGHGPGISGSDLNAYLAAGVTSDHEATTWQEGIEKIRRGCYLMLREASGGICDGHGPGISGSDLNAYLAAGVTSDHEATTWQEGIEKIRRGCYLMLREASGAHNLLELLQCVTPLNSRRCCMATDDRHLDELVTQGSINYMLEIGVTHGYPAEMLLQMATLNTAERFRLHYRGALAPGYLADINVLTNLQDFTPQFVFKNGKKVVQNGKLLWESEPYLKPAAAGTNIKDLDSSRLKIMAEPDKNIKVIRIVPEQILTEARLEKPLCINSEAVSDTSRDILKLAVFERHHATGNVGLGFVQGLKLKRGAVASTVAHDSHNLIVAGTNDADMLTAAAALRKEGGGIAVALDGEVKAILPLPFAGLMSGQRMEFVNRRLKQLRYWTAELGVPEGLNVFMVLSFLALPVIPHLRLTDKGLADVDKFALTGLWA